MATKKRRNRSRKSPNVYVQAQREREELEQAVATTEASTDAAAGPSSGIRSRTPDQGSQPRASRLTQTTRSDVYAVSIPNEMRKMGILAVGLVAALVVFSFVLG